MTPRTPSNPSDYGRHSDSAERKNRVRAAGSANPVPTPPSQPYTALYDVKIENILDEAVKQVDFLFGVPVRVVTDAGFDPRYDIELLRYTDAWEKLETPYVWEEPSQQAGMDWYAAKSPGFSYYAVGFTENVTRLPAEIWTTTPTFAGVFAAAGAVMLYLRRR